MEGECPDEIKFSSLEVVILVNSGQPVISSRFQHNFRFSEHAWLPAMQALLREGMRLDMYFYFS